MNLSAGKMSAGQIITSFLQEHTQWAFTCSKLTIETLEQDVKYVQS